MLLTSDHQGSGSRLRGGIHIDAVPKKDSDFFQVIDRPHERGCACIIGSFRVESFFSKATRAA